MSAGLVAAIFGAGVFAPAASADEAREQQYWIKDYGIDQAWKVTRGAGVTVAVIDSGVDTSHQDLSGAMAGGYDASGAGAKNGSKPLGSLPEHGTLVATMLAGRGNNSELIGKLRAQREKAQESAAASAKASASAKAAASSSSAKPSPLPKPGPGDSGIIGVAPEAKLLSVSLLMGEDNPGGPDVDAQVADAVKWSVDNGAKVINISLGSTGQDWPESWDDAFLYAEQKDVLIVAAAGNRSGGMLQVGAPATIPGVLVVAGVDRDNKASWDSSTQGISIGVAAPAVDLVGGIPGGGYTTWSGTSGAAPIVAGVAALIRAKYPELSAAEVRHRIEATAKDAGPDGFDNQYGFGLIDANAALTAELPAWEPDASDTIAEWIRVHRRGTVPSPSAIAAEPSDTGQPSTHAAPEPVTPARGTSVPALMVLSAGLLILVTGATAVVLYVQRRKNS
ncbi:S8 family serine peptidase [Neomicrococcus aestuarii]|uniref:S8 family serine peptidase n=1 Tax=Neomicrococcus aestuarii TaxID=556325 RepID=UPI003001923B